MWLLLPLIVSVAAYMPARHVTHVFIEGNSQWRTKADLAQRASHDEHENRERADN